MPTAPKSEAPLSPAEALRRRVREVRDALPDGVTLPEMLLTLANRPGAARMLGDAFPGINAVEIRKALAAASALVRTVEEWAERPKAARQKPSDDKPDTESPKPSAEKTAPSAARPTGTGVSDPEAIARHHAVKVHVDGASKGNPGPSSAGIVVTDLEGEPIYEEGLYLGEMTNNAAEYRGLIRVLEILSQHGRPMTYVFSDSLLMVNQMNLEWQVKHPDIRSLFSQAQILKRRLPKFEIRHVPRERNRRADELANLAIKRHHAAKSGRG